MAVLVDFINASLTRTAESPHSDGKQAIGC
jgi:hypothetical protein